MKVVVCKIFNMLKCRFKSNILFFLYLMCMDFTVRLLEKKLS